MPFPQVGAGARRAAAHSLPLAARLRVCACACVRAECRPDCRRGRARAMLPTTFAFSVRGFAHMATACCTPAPAPAATSPPRPPPLLAYLLTPPWAPLHPPGVGVALSVTQGGVNLLVGGAPIGPIRTGGGEGGCGAPTDMHCTHTAAKLVLVSTLCQLWPCGAGGGHVQYGTYRPRPSVTCESERHACAHGWTPRCAQQ